VARLGDPTQAAIASSLAAEIYGLAVLSAGIEDAEHNTTRFVVLSREPVDPDPTAGPVMTTFVFQVRNVPAALYKALGGFATNRVNMVKLESYMLDGSFSATQFYADIEGHPDDPGVRFALEELGFFSRRVKVLGVYHAHPFRRR
jgi:prephenate dehydratase